MRHVRGVHDDEGAFSGCDITKGTPFENMPVIIFSSQIAPGEGRRQKPHPIGNIEQGSSNKTSLNVLLQKLAFKILKDPVSEEAVLPRRETPSGDTRYSIHLIQKPPFSSVKNDFSLPQFLENAIGK